MLTIPFARRRLAVIAALWLGAGLVGCGGRGDATKRFDLSGSVTFDGKAVPAGTILFEPDSSKGNKGPAGFAKIADGRFDTAAGGKGTIGGPHVVRITGSDEATLFSDYVTQADLPKEKSTKDFEVPASAKAPAGSHPGPNYRGP